MPSAVENDYVYLKKLHTLSSIFADSVRKDLERCPVLDHAFKSAVRPGDLKALRQQAQTISTIQAQQGLLTREERAHLLLARLRDNDVFTRIAARALRDDHLRMHVPAEIGTQENLAVLEKYKLNALVSIARL